MQRQEMEKLYVNFTGYGQTLEAQNNWENNKDKDNQLNVKTCINYASKDIKHLICELLSTNAY